MTSVVLCKSENRNSMVPYGYLWRCGVLVRHPQSGRARREICIFRFVPFQVQERRAEYILVLELDPVTILPQSTKVPCQW